MRHDHVVPGAQPCGIEARGELLGVLVCAGAKDHGDGGRQDANGVIRQVGSGIVVGRHGP
jgi:hypothetical protein